VDTSNAGAVPVSVLFEAALANSQSLSSDLDGISATSEVTFQFSLPDIPAVPLLSYDNLLTIGAGQIQSTTASPTLISSTTLLTNTPYSFFLETASSSNGVSAATPEPGTLFLLISGFAFVAFSSARRH
jgi:hypothetical protein